MHQPMEHHADAPVAVTIGDAVARYGFPDMHPFGPFRMDAFWQEAIRRGLDQRVLVQTPVAATREELLLFHRADYIDRVERLSRLGEGLLDQGDTPAFPGVYEAASHVVGSSLALMEGILAGRWRRAFNPIAGLHHARPHSAGGFCVFNDCAVVIHALRQRHGLSRIAYVDIDAHHGDGVFYAFEDDPELIFADFHQDGRTLYPGTGDDRERGRGDAEGRKRNIPLPPGADDSQFFKAWPAVERFLIDARPAFILLQCGADSIAGDPLTRMSLSPAAHAHAAQRLCKVAEGMGHGRVLAVGGGGYNPVNIGRGWCAVVQALLESPVTGC